MRAFAAGPRLLRTAGTARWLRGSLTPGLAGTPTSPAGQRPRGEGQPLPLVARPTDRAPDFPRLRLKRARFKNTSNTAGPRPSGQTGLLERRVRGKRYLRRLRLDLRPVVSVIQTPTLPAGKPRPRRRALSLLGASWTAGQLPSNTCVSTRKKTALPPQTAQSLFGDSLLDCTILYAHCFSQ